MMSYRIRLKRIYDPVEPADGCRVLVDRLWPRGTRKDSLDIAEWYRDAAPSTALRRAWHKGDMDADTFAGDYVRELEARAESLVPLMRYARKGSLTLLTASRDPRQSHLPVLRRVVLAALEEEDRQADGGEPSSPVCYDK